MKTTAGRKSNDSLLSSVAASVAGSEEEKKSDKAGGAESRRSSYADLQNIDKTNDIDDETKNEKETVIETPKVIPKGPSVAIPKYTRT